MTLLKLRSTQYSETLEVVSIMFPGLAKSMDRCIYILCLGALERMTAPETDLRELLHTVFKKCKYYKKIFLLSLLQRRRIRENYY